MNPRVLAPWEDIPGRKVSTCNEAWALLALSNANGINPHFKRLQGLIQPPKLTLQFSARILIRPAKLDRIPDLPRLGDELHGMIQVA